MCVSIELATTIIFHIILVHRLHGEGRIGASQYFCTFNRVLLSAFGNFHSSHLEASMGQITHDVRIGDDRRCGYTGYVGAYPAHAFHEYSFSLFHSPWAVGYHIGVINSPAESMKKWCKETLLARYGVQLSFDQLQILWSAVVSIFLIGGCLGSLVGAWFADRFGRKLSLLNCGILFVLGAILFYLCRLCESVEILVAARLVVGLAAGLSTSILPMYLAEVAPLELRGTLAVLAATGS